MRYNGQWGHSCQATTGCRSPHVLRRSLCQVGAVAGMLGLELPSWLIIVQGGRDGQSHHGCQGNTQSYRLSWAVICVPAWSCEPPSLILTRDWPGTWGGSMKLGWGGGGLGFLTC